MPRVNTNSVIYDSKQHNIVSIIELHNRGVELLCRWCHSPLIVALTREDANKHKVHPGVFCPLDRKHLTILAELTD